ncbi:MAG: phospholipase, partial [Lysobacterales bacterium]
MNNEVADESPIRRRFRKRWLVWGALLWWSGVGVWNVTKPMPAGTNLNISSALTPADSVEFIYDLTRAGPQGQMLHEQRIFDETFRIIDEAETFVVADFFLLNEQMGDGSGVHRRLSHELVDRLIARKAAKPGISMLLITDPINTVYGGAQSTLLDELRDAGVDVVTTELDRLRDSNPLYSSFWRMFLQWWGNSADGGSAVNPFATDGSQITVRSWLALLNSC